MKIVFLISLDHIPQDIVHYLTIKAPKNFKTSASMYFFNIKIYLHFHR